MSELIQFFSLSDVNVRSVVLGSALLGITAGAIGTFALLRKRALIGDALAHSTLPGVVLGFVIAGGKVPLALLLGAMLTAWLAALAVNLISARSKIKNDSAMAVVLSVFFAAGIVGLTMVQKSGSAAQSGLEHFLFGRAASLIGDDVTRFAIIAGISLATLLLLFKELKVVAFDGTFTRALGLPAHFLDFILTTLMVVAVVVGIQAVGVVLMAAMLITPPAAARLWTNRLSTMVLLAALFGALAGMSGAFLSSLAPRMPTGPWMVMAVTVIFVLSMIFAPERGILSRRLAFLRLHRKIIEEHILKAIHRPDGAAGPPIPVSVLEAARFARPGELSRAIGGLAKRGLLARQGDALRLTPSGVERAKRILRRHRLWELYLSVYMQLPADHVHRDADEMEHVLTPELEAELDALLKSPTQDPHGRPIPQPVGDSP